MDLEKFTPKQRQNIKRNIGILIIIFFSFLLFKLFLYQIAK